MMVGDKHVDLAAAASPDGPVEPRWTPSPSTRSIVPPPSPR